MFGGFARPGDPETGAPGGGGPSRQGGAAGYTTIASDSSGPGMAVTPPGLPHGPGRDMAITPTDLDAPRRNLLQRWALWSASIVLLMAPIMLAGGALGAWVDRRSQPDRQRVDDVHAEATVMHDDQGIGPIFVHAGRCASDPLATADGQGTSLGSCSKACTTTSLCAYFSFIAASNKCFLYDLAEGCPWNASDTSGAQSFLVAQGKVQNLFHEQRHDAVPVGVSHRAGSSPTPSTTQHASRPKDQKTVASHAQPAGTTKTDTTTILRLRRSRPAPKASSAKRSHRSTTETAASTRRTELETTTNLLRPYPSLYCFSVMQSTTYELSLIRTQLERGAGIFACDDWAVFSDAETWLSPGPPVMINSTKLTVDMRAKAGVQEHILNTQIFISAWDRVLQDGAYLKNKWVVKVDPDAVFFPDRLRMVLHRTSPEADEKIYFLNCKLSFGFYGALEVVSSLAVWSYGGAQQQCLHQLPVQDWGEDLYLRKCFDLIGVSHKTNLDILDDAYCGARAGHCDSNAVAFHPYKNAYTYFKCLEQAAKADAGS